ncbi:DUF3106 domain-containing protein [Variovorax sp. J22R133]|uniref:DUF3106 domain-containing protein n=1 Tax=Variovorax brevis TaxID=3053503 RepID=UPI0025768B53|nr:DUF3106 domain-containing protein [Variovorax sp. J22R133]MDM0112415.1 DUF3106 domain-containing protein [Variovorax sp. J22R133]
MFTDPNHIRRLPAAGRGHVPHLAFACLLGLVLIAGAQLPAYAQSGGATGGSTAAAGSAKPAITSRPLWNELSPTQHESLAPLAPHWNNLHEAQKRKWIALSRNYDSMTPDEQATLHSRMTEWAGLSPQERTQARLNFAEVKRLSSADDRKAKWEAYQALSDEDRRKLAERAGTRPPSAAAPARPVPSQKLAPVPAATTAGGQHMPRIQLAPPAATPEPATLRTTGPASPAQ